MSKTLLEMVEELNRKPVSERPRIPLVTDKANVIEVAAEKLSDDEHEDRAEGIPDSRRDFERALAAKGARSR
jgi:hypothetical protein